MIIIIMAMVKSVLVAVAEAMVVVSGSRILIVTVAGVEAGLATWVPLNLFVGTNVGNPVTEVGKKVGNRVGGDVGKKVGNRVGDGVAPHTVKLPQDTAPCPVSKHALPKPLG